MDQPACPHCGGASQGLVCSFCGALLTPTQDSGTQKRALDDFHGLLANATPESQAKLLRHGFLPDSPHVLIEAGLRTMLLLQTDSAFSEVATGAAGRLKTIESKLRLLPESDESRKALKEFDAALRDHEKRDAMNTRQAFTFVGVVLAILVGAIWYLVRRAAG
jgi:hypothetical protein